MSDSPPGNPPHETGFDPPQVQEIVDQIQEAAGAVQGVLQELPLFLGSVAETVDD